MLPPKAGWQHWASHLPAGVKALSEEDLHLTLTLAQGREPVADLMRNWGNRARQAAGLEPDRRQPDTHVTLAGVASSW